MGSDPQQYQGAELEAQIPMEKAPQPEVMPRDVGVSMWKPWLRPRVSKEPMQRKKRAKDRTGAGRERGATRPSVLRSEANTASI